MTKTFLLEYPVPLHVGCGENRAVQDVRVTRTQAVHIDYEEHQREIARYTVKHRSRIPRNVVVLGLVSLLTDAATEMIYPLIPLFVAALGAGAVTLGLIEGVAETTAAMLKLASGALSDRIGKRKALVVAGYAISSLIRPFTGVVTAAWQIIVVRMCDRVGKGIRAAPRDALIAASADVGIRGRAYGFHRAMDHAGAVIGPLLAILTLTILVIGFGMDDTVLVLRWTFGLSIIPGFCAVLILVLCVREKTAGAGRSGTAAFSFRRFDGNFLSYLAVVFLFTLGNSSDAFLLFRIGETVRESGSFHGVVSAVPLIGEVTRSFGNARHQEELFALVFLPLVWAYFHVIKTLFSTPLGALSDRIGRKRVITAGWVIYACVYTGFALLDRIGGTWQLPAAFGLLAVYALFYAFTEGAERAFVADLIRPEQQGTAFGLYNFAVGLGALPASVIFGILYQRYGAAVAFTTGAVLALAAMVLLTTAVREGKTGRP